MWFRSSPIVPFKFVFDDLVQVSAIFLQLKQPADLLTLFGPSVVTFIQYAKFSGSILCLR